MQAISLKDLNALDRAGFVARLGHLFEHSPWVVEAAWGRRPFAGLDDLHRALIDAVDEAGPDRQLALVRAHPDLAGKAALAGELTADSRREQASAGLDRLSPADYARFHDLNAAYRGKFGFPFIICVRRHDVAGILDAFARRLAGDADSERRNALAEIGLITRLRLADAGIVEDEAP